ncbi:MAG: hypothetical protein ACI37U_09120 [Bacteroides sp.]
MFPTSLDVSEALNEIKIEGLKVKFDAKVYEFNREYTDKLPQDVDLYIMQSPEYTITVQDE